MKLKIFICLPLHNRLPKTGWLECAQNNTLLSYFLEFLNEVYFPVEGFLKCVLWYQCDGKYLQFNPTGRLRWEVCWEMEVNLVNLWRHCFCICHWPKGWAIIETLKKQINQTKMFITFINDYCCEFCL